MRLRDLTILAALALAACPVRAESFGSWAAKGDKLEKRGDDDGARGAYSQALKLWRKKDGKAPKAKVLSARAALFEKNQAWENAIRDLAAAAEISTRTASYRYRAGRDALELGRPSEAITWFYKATKLNLSYKEAFYDRARAYEATGDLEFAREDYRTACRLAVKAACAREKELKAGRKPAAAPDSSKAVHSSTAPAAGALKAVRIQKPLPPPPDEFKPAPSKPKNGVEIKRKTTRVAKASVKNFSACLDGLDACVAGGGTFGDCVGQAGICEKKAAKGCCPQACVESFKAFVDAEDKSEAAAFRETFKADADCVKSSSAKGGSE